MYYHITGFEEVLLIIKNGLRANAAGQIFLFTREEIAASIALNQTFHSDYGLFEVNEKGVTGKIENDNVGELTTKFQFILHQDLIEPQYLTFKGMYKR